MEALHFGEGNGHPHRPMAPAVHTDAREVAKWSPSEVGNTNNVADCLSRPPIMALTTVLNSYGHEMSDWPLLYKSDPEFGHTYQTLLEGQHVPDFHLKDALLCHLGHLCVPSSECSKMIGEAHYSHAARHFGIEKIVAVLQKYFYWPNLWQDVGKYIRSCTDCAIYQTDHQEVRPLYFSPYP